MNGSNYEHGWKLLAGIAGGVVIPALVWLLAFAILVREAVQVLPAAAATSALAEAGYADRDYLLAVDRGSP